MYIDAAYLLWLECVVGEWRREDGAITQEHFNRRVGACLLRDNYKCLLVTYHAVLRNLYGIVNERGGGGIFKIVIVPVVHLAPLFGMIATASMKVL